MSRLESPQRWWLAVIAGAVCGGAVGYVCFTERGRRVLERTAATLDEAIEQMQQVRRAVVAVNATIEEGRQARQALHDLRLFDSVEVDNPRVAH
jgi:hypothetical protein